MQIQVLGSGCANCKKLFETVKKIALELNLNEEVEYIDDVTKIAEMGVMTSPVLAIDGNPVLMGGGISEEDIKDVLENKPLEQDDHAGCCSCGHNC